MAMQSVNGLDILIEGSIRSQVLSARNREPCRGIFAGYENLEKFTALLFISSTGWYDFCNLILTVGYPIGYPIIRTQNYSVKLLSKTPSNFRTGVLRILLGLSRSEES